MLIESMVRDVPLKPLAALAAGTLLATAVFGQQADAGGAVASTGVADASDASPIFGVAIPAGYRQWELIAVSYETAFDEFRGILGNPLAIRAYGDATLPFPDGTILTKLAWKRVPSTEFNGAFVPGAATTVQFMVKDAKKYASTGGWGFGRFINGKPVDEAQHKTCFACHLANVKWHDLVFTRYAP
jgi:hypothetical protein